MEKRFDARVVCITMSNILELLKTSKKTLFVGLAGPGTGKSTTFKEIVESDEYKGKKILILSFINKLVNDLNSDFKDYENVKVLTLHAFAKQNITDDIDLDEDLDKLISDDFKFLNGKTIEYEKKFFEESLDSSEEKFYKDRTDFYKNQKKIYSFNSIIYAINLWFRKYENKIPNEWDLILVDEFQDFNKSEYELIKQLNKKCKVVVVGDDDQSLYSSFRNAKPEQIRYLYNDPTTEEFTLDYCYRCTRVIVNAVNSLIQNGLKNNYLKDRLSTKKFLYPEGKRKEKDEASNKYCKIDFIPSVSGDLLIYKLSEAIKKDINNDKNKRVLVIAPNYFKKSIYEGLLENKFNVVEFELFSNEKSNKVKHKKLINLFKTLSKRKMDNLAIRNVLCLYLSEDEIKNLLIKSHDNGDKKLWLCLDKNIQNKIETDIKIYKKVKKGKIELTNIELARFSKIFNIKNVLSKMIKGFDSVSKNSIEVEMTTLMKSKGLSADFVYYIGIDDSEMLDLKNKQITDQKICEFLVAITRAKEKLTLISNKDKNPKILDFVDKKYINIKN